MKTDVLDSFLAETQSVLTEPDDMAIQTPVDEVLIVVRRPSDNRLHILRHKLEKILVNSGRFHWNSSGFVPMLGMSVYPADACPVRELDGLARRRQVVIGPSVDRAKTR